MDTEKNNTELRYAQAKKKVKEIKGFYIHLAINCMSVVIVIVVNLLFVPSFHFFWFVLLGCTIAQLIHWMVVFGLPKYGLGKDWEERKIKELMEEEYKKSLKNNKHGV